MPHCLPASLLLFPGWPFAALLGLPIAVDILMFRRQHKLFLTWSVISAVIILTPQLLCDSYYYGKPVMASLNIVLYNVFTPHGPDLYGTEPAQFYLINGFLNFNVVFLLALVGLPVLLGTKYLLRGEIASTTTGFYLSETLSQAPLLLWLLVFWTRPHKGGVQKFLLNRLVDFSIKWVGGVPLVH